MREYKLAIAFGLSLVILFGLQILAPPTSALTIPATIEIDPKTLNLMERGVITVYIWLPGYDVNEIDVSTVRFDGQSFPPLRGNVEGDKMIVKFDALLVTDYIWHSEVGHMGTIPPQEPEYRITITITGSLTTGDDFAGEYEIRIILPQPL